MTGDPLSIGTFAPAFEAPANDGQRYELTELLKQGGVALFFYPGNNTPG
jgi:peroxiredoxin